PYLAPHFSEGVTLLIQTLISTLIILVAGEFVPKMLFKSMPNFWMNTMSVPLFFFYILLYPISMFMSWLSKSIMRLFGVKIKSEEATMLGRVDLDYFIQESSEAAGADEKVDKEVQIFQNALDFSKVKLRDCMVPRTEIEAVAFDDDIDELTKVFCESGRSKVMVYKESIDNIIGYVHTIEMFKRPQKWQDRIILAPIVPETMAANRLMNLMLLKKKSMAVVVDEFGGTSGIVTLEDIVEEIFGEIEDEHDTQDYVDKKLSEREYLLSGRLEVDVLNEKYDWKLPLSDEYQTLAGLVLYTYQGIPAEGEEITLPGYILKIVKATQNKLELIKLTVM
ncbi:MAG: HlyC/CorC family transporter, partial [Paludibacteraceae bacterium]|nr:HlyC/CorC family transporter [Paludibacteraceae bacterium]